MAQADLLHIEDFAKIFLGNDQNYGLHDYRFSDKDGDKEQGKNRTIKNTLLTNEQYRAHLDGTQGLGIIPITTNNKAKVGIIDIDLYGSDVSVSEYLRAIDEHGFPLVPFKSKSGGYHIYMFLEQEVNAVSVVDLMKQFSVVLGFDLLMKQRLNRMVEIFPKQTKLRNGEVGSWINLPYYNAANTRQYCVYDEAALNLEEALIHIKSRMTTVKDAKTYIKELPFGDGPPCLQSLYLLNPLDKDSGRNNYLFGFAVYHKKKDEEFFEQNLVEINTVMREPLSLDELDKTVISSLRKKDYAYRCTQSPLVDFCRKGLCKQREFGVGKIGGYFSTLEYGKMYQIKTSQPYYEWEVKVQGDDEWLRLRFKNEDEIIRQDAFLRLCIREIHMLPPKLKLDEWFKIVNQSLAEIEVTEVEKDDDISPIAIFKSLFFEFIFNRAMAETKDQMYSKRVYFDDKTKVYYFRAKDLSEFVFVNKSFRFFSPSEMHSVLIDMEAKPSRIKTETDKQIRVYGIKANAFGDEALLREAHGMAKFEPDFTKYEEEAF